MVRQGYGLRMQESHSRNDIVSHKNQELGQVGQNDLIWHFQYHSE